MGIKFNPFTGNFDIVGTTATPPPAPVDSVNGQTGVVQLDAVDIPYDNTASGLVATEVQAALDELKVITDRRDSETIYVDANEGDDTTGTGSILNPVATIQKAVTLVTNPAIGYVIRLGPGSYSGPQVEWPPNADLIGAGANSTNVQSVINYTALPGSQTGFNMSLVSANLTLDLEDAAVAIPTLFNGSFGIIRTDVSAPGPRALLISDSTLGDCDLSSNNLLSNCLMISTFIVRTSGQLLCSDVTIGIQLELEGAAQVALSGCTVPGIINGTTIGLDTPTVRTDAGSLTGATTNNVIIQLADTASYINYDPTDSGLAAVNVQDAIDEIALVVGNSVVFRPGGVDDKNVYNSFSDAVDALSTVDGPKILYFDDSITSPAVVPVGTYDMENIQWRTGKPLGEPAVISVSDGAILPNLRSFYSVSVTFLGTSPINSITSGINVITVDGSDLTAAGTGPVISIAAPTQITLREGGNLFASPTASVFEIAPSTSIQTVMYLGSNIDQYGFSGDNTASLTIIYADGTDSFINPQVNFSGAVSEINLADAKYINYNNTISGLTATNVQSAIDESAGNVDDLITLSGVSSGSTDLGIFTGTIISDNVDIKVAIQELESSIESIPDPISYEGIYDASSNTPTLDNTDTGVTGFLYQVTVAGTVDFGAGNISFNVGDKVVNNGSEWEKWDMTDSVSSVNGQIGAVSLALDDISDVVLAAPSIGDVLSYDGSDWVNAAPASGGANTALSNLTTTSINQNLLPDTNGSRSIGSNALRWNGMYAAAFAFSNTDYLTVGEWFHSGNSRVDVRTNDSVHRQTAFQRSSSITGTNYVSERYYDSLTLAANTTSATTIPSFISLSTATVAKAVQIEYSITEATSLKQRTGRLMISTDGTNISYTDTFTETAVLGSALGLSLSAVLSSGNIVVQFNNTHATNACTMRADVKYFRP